MFNTSVAKNISMQCVGGNSLMQFIGLKVTRSSLTMSNAQNVAMFVQRHTPPTSVCHNAHISKLDVQLQVAFNCDPLIFEIRHLDLDTV